MDIKRNDDMGTFASIAFDTRQPHGARVRRPLGGVSVKPNTAAFVQVIRSDGAIIKVFNQLGSTGRDVGNHSIPSAVMQTTLEGELLGSEAAVSGDPQSPIWTDWLLQTVVEARREKIQIIETFGETVMFAYGERARFLNFSGYLMNTADFNWRAQFWENWDQHFRATKLVENDARLFIGFDDIIVSGYPFDARARQMANNPRIIIFDFKFFVSTYVNTFIQNAGSVQAKRSIGGATDSNVVRLNEFISSGVFADKSFDIGSGKIGGLASILGGDRLRFAEYMQSITEGLSVGTFPGLIGLGLKELLFNPALRYIKGTRTATEYLLSIITQEANTLAYVGVDKLAESTPGGHIGLNFFFGALGALYQIVGINALSLVGLRSDQPTLWSNMLDNIAQVGDPNRHASYMGYTASSLVGSFLYSQTDRYELSGQHWNDDYGFVTNTQNEAIGATVFRRDNIFDEGSPGIITGEDLVPLQASSTGSVQTTTLDGFTSPTGEADPSVSSESDSLSSVTFTDSRQSERDELDAVDVQNEERQANHGVIDRIDDPEELAEDGSE
jgi:hypothetical protein